MRSLMALAFAIGAASSALGATVVDTYTGDTSSDLRNSVYAAAFTPSADYDFTGATAFVDNSGATAEPVSIFIYSSTGGAPASLLWSSGALSAAAGASTLLSADYSGPTLPLDDGVEYFLAVDATSSQVGWLYTPGDSIPLYASNDHGDSFFSISGLGVPEFQVFGASLAPSAPEPSTWAMMMLGAAGLGVTALRRSRRA